MYGNIIYDDLYNNLQNKLNKNKITYENAETLNRLSNEVCEFIESVENNEYRKKLPYKCYTTDGDVYGLVEVSDNKFEYKKFASEADYREYYHDYEKEYNGN